jgi:transketolase
MDCKKIIQAVIKAKSQSLCPSLIICNTVIGYGTALSGSSKSHGSPLGDECIANFKNQINWKYEPFSIPKEVQIHIEQIKVRLEKKEQEWCILVENYKSKFPALFDEYQSWLSGFEKMHNFDFGSLNTVQKSADSTRNICGSVLNKLAEKLPNIFGGSADLASSNKTTIQSSGVYSFENRCGKNIGYGVREHAMAGIANGMQLHGGFINFVSTFFVFSDYLKGSLRMSALMNLPLLYIFTHDSIGVGEDGPTHQPVEHLTALRSLPNLKVFRPADSKETVAAFECWLKGHSAFAFCLSRQELSILPNNSGDPKKGGYIVVRPSATPKVILIATGSEVALALQAQKILSNQKICASVVSMPCTQIFDEQDEEYKQSILPNSVRVRVAIEAGSSLGWYKYVGLDGAVVGIDRFGKSGKYDEVFEHFGFLANNVAKVAEDCLNNYQKYGNTVKK